MVGKFSELNVMMGSPSPDLFIRADGQPMAFLMGPTGFERQQVWIKKNSDSDKYLTFRQVKNYVETGGGVILNQPTLAYRDYMIRLLV